MTRPGREGHTTVRISGGDVVIEVRVGEGLPAWGFLHMDARMARELARDLLGAARRCCAARP